MESEATCQQPVLVIAGMHRSGTSLIASLLQSAGLDIGQNLLAGSESNPKGHFENLDFFAFHQGVLLSIGTNDAGWTTQRDSPVPEYYVDEAKTLIHNSASRTQPWGWKDPRTTLFLNFWAALLPEARFLLVYRSPWDVLDSLYRRGDAIFHHNPQFALDIWMNYNQIILDFYQRFPDRCFLTHLKQVTAHPAAFIESVNQRFSLSLNAPENDLYDASLLSTIATNSQRSLLIQRYFPNADTLYQQLNRVAAFSEETTLATPDLVPQTAWLLKDWLDVRCLQRELKEKTSRLHDQLASSQAELTNAAHERQQLQVDNQQLQANYQHLQANYQHLQEANQKSDADNQMLQKERQTMQAEINRLLESEAQFKHQLKLQLEHKQAEIDAMKTSKFWRLRSHWFKLKRLAHLPQQ